MTLLSVLLASLLGSLHCVAMCGGFAGYCGGQGQHRTLSLLTYNLGRLFSYVVLGALAGYAGQVLNLGSGLIGVQQGAALLAGVLLIWWGSRSLFGLVQPTTLEGSGSNTGFLRRRLAKIFSPNPDTSWAKRSVMLGLLSGLLPCGWLYAYVAVAAASGTPVLGMLIMGVFWVGTVPALLFCGSVGRVLALKLGPQLPRVTALLLIAAGFFSLSGHVFSSHGDHGDHGHHDHHHHASHHPLAPLS